MKWLKAVRAGSKSKSFGASNFSELTSEERTRYSSCLKYACASFCTFLYGCSHFKKVINPKMAKSNINVFLLTGCKPRPRSVCFLYARKRPNKMTKKCTFFRMKTKGPNVCFLYAQKRPNKVTKSVLL